MKKLYKYITFIFIPIFTSCFEEIPPNFELEEQVFISGLLTSEESFVSVQIQKTVAITDTIFNAVNDAQVSLFTRDQNNEVSLVSDSFVVTNGDYRSSDMITPTIGNSYWIEVTLSDQTVFTSKEEILKPPLGIIDMVRTENEVRVTFENQINEQNFFFIRFELLKDNILINSGWDLFSDTATNTDAEEFILLSNINRGETLRVIVHNVNSDTFQFYRNIFGSPDDPYISTLFSPINLYGNVTNATTDKIALGNFGIAGFSTMTMDF